MGGKEGKREKKGANDVGHSDEDRRCAYCLARCRTNCHARTLLEHRKHSLSLVSKDTLPESFTSGE